MADQVPGVYTTFERDSDVSGTAPNSRCLIWGLVAPGAPATVGVPFLATGLAQVRERCGASWAQLARNYEAARAEPAADGAEIWCVPQADPAGTSATRPLKFGPAPTYDATDGWLIGTATAAAAPTTGWIDVGGQVAQYEVSSGDTWAQIAAKAGAALATLGADLVYAPSVNGATVTLTDRHASAITDDLPIRCWFSNPAAGVAVILGTVTLATTATGAGSVSLTDGVITASDTIANNDTATTTATQLRNAVNAGPAYRAATDGANAGVVTIYARDDAHARRLSATITAAIGTTVALSAGTAGSGTPSLTGPLATLGADPTAYRAWALAQADATALGAAAAHLIAQDAAAEKGQILYAAISSALPSVSLIGATTPALSTTELCVILHAQAATVPAAQIAARVSVQVAAEGQGDQGRNYNGLRLTPTDQMPLAAAPRALRSQRDTWNAGISAGYAPVTCDDVGRWYVVMARTTWGSAAPVTAKLRKWSGALLPMYFRADLRQHLVRVFFRPGDGKSLKVRGTPHTARAIDAQGVRSEILGKIREWDAADYFDGTDDIVPAVRIEITGGRVKVAVPFRSVTDLDRIEVVGYPA